LKPFPSVYDEADYVLRDGIFHVYVGWGQYANAAQVLSGTNMASNSRPFTDLEKVDIYIKCAEAFLEEEAAVDAEVFANKASPFINNINDWTLLLRYRVTMARVLDANRKFIEAALRYYELSATDNHKIVAEELLELLGKAVTCTILGKSGQQRNRVLGLLYNVRFHFISFLIQYISDDVFFSLFSPGCSLNFVGSTTKLFFSFCLINQNVQRIYHSKRRIR
jgi:COP9 signalosome complex subunit 4